MCGFSKFTSVAAMAFGVALWIQIMKRNKLCNSDTDLTGKTVLITGGNTGIGYETALGIAKLNAKVIIACRNEEKAKAAVAQIKKTAGTMSVAYLIFDLAEMADIKRAAEEFMQREDRLDILINNAGVFTSGKSKDGFDRMFAINYLSSFMLANLLMPLMRKTSKTSPVRIVNLSSVSYLNGIVDFDNLSPDITERSSVRETTAQYSNTKLMNIHFTRELDARLKEEFKSQRQAITTYSVHPGIINTNLGQEYFRGKNIVTKLLWDVFFILFEQPVAHGAQTSICCAVKEGIEEFSGGYFSNMQPAELANHAQSSEVFKVSTQH